MILPRLVKCHHHYNSLHGFSLFCHLLCFFLPCKKNWRSRNMGSDECVSSVNFKRGIMMERRSMPKRTAMVLVRMLTPHQQSIRQK